MPIQRDADYVPKDLLRRFGVHPVLFVERCFDMLRDGGRLAIVLPEIVIHGKDSRRIRDYIVSNGSVQAIVDLPHNTFRPYYNAKTCLLVATKGQQAQDSDDVIMAQPVAMGLDHQGGELYQPGTNEIWDDLDVVRNEISHPTSSDNQFLTTVK